MVRAAIAILSTENLLHNLEVIRTRSNNVPIIAMIKANAYGHGIRSTALRLEGKVYSLGVASIDEAIALRKAGVKMRITLMSGAFEPDDLLVAACENFQLIFHNVDQIEWLSKVKLPNPIEIWFKIDSGMGRLGFDLEIAEKAYKELSNNAQVVQPIGIISHLACSDDVDHPLNIKQIDNFNKFTEKLPGLKSLLSSAGIFNFAAHVHDVVRPGIALYGISPIKNKIASDLGLKPVMTLQTRLVAVKDVKASSNIGYGARFTCPQDMKIGVIAMGYGDGYPRSAKDGTPILVNNKRCQLVGRVSMDMITIDLRTCPEAQVGDSVILWGEGLPIEEVAQYTDNIAYDIICAVQQRVKFYWTRERKDYK